MSGLKLVNVDKNFGSVKVIKGVNLDIDEGEFVVFVGPSGCGKSTLLRVISGLEEASSGDEKNLGFGLRMGGMPKEDVAVRVKEAARILDISSFMHRKPKALSGGQRQRVAIGRAIVRQPDVFLFDEPLSNLDAELRTQTRLEITRLHQELKATMIFVTHDQVEAMTLADKIVVLRDGKVEQVGAPLNLYDDPDNMFVAGFIGSPKMNLLSAQITDANKKSVSISVPDLSEQTLTIETRDENNAKIGDEITIGIRPEHFIDANLAKATFTAKVEMIEQLGGLSYVHAVGKNETPLSMQESGRSSIQLGNDVQFGVDLNKCLLFDDKGQRI